MKPNLVNPFQPHKPSGVRAFLGRLGSRTVRVFIPNSAAQISFQGTAAWVGGMYAPGLYLKWVSDRTTRDFGRKVFEWTGVRAFSSFAEWAVGPFAINASLAALPVVRKVGCLTAYVAAGILFVCLTRNRDE